MRRLTQKALEEAGLIEVRGFNVEKEFLMFGGGSFRVPPNAGNLRRVILFHRRSVNHCVALLRLWEDLIFVR